MSIHISTLALILTSTFVFSQENFTKQIELTIENDTVKVKKFNLNEVTIQGQNPDKKISSTKANINPIALPQATSVVTEKMLQQQVNSMNEILKNANGVYISGNTGGYQEEIASRGFSLGSKNSFENGVRYYNGMLTETSALELN